MKDAKIFIPLIVVLLSGAGWTLKEVYGTIKETADLKAEVKFQNKYEDVITENIVLRVQSCCDTVRR